MRKGANANGKTANVRGFARKGGRSMYVALAYVYVDKHLYVPGEIIRDDPKAEWHLKTGAIKRMDDAEPKRETEKIEQEQNAEDVTMENNDETDNKMEAPEIDVASAIVQKPAKSAATRTRKGAKAT